MKRLRQIIPVLSVLSLFCLAYTGTAMAGTFNKNNVITDVAFDNTHTMKAGDIDAFLNHLPNSCISTNHGFRAIEPIGYNPTGGFSYGGSVTAGQVVYDASTAYGINPQVILATIQKEQSLVDGSAGCSTLRYAAATGYGCPDGGTTHNYSGVNLYSLNGTAVTSVSGTCVNSSLKVGFSQQVIRTAWLLKFGEQRSEGHINWTVISGNWNNSDDPQNCYGGPMTQGTFQRCPSGATTFYDGYITVDGASTHMDNGATASLYWYTPHLSGNQSFFTIFTSWFGSTQISLPYSWQLISSQVFSDAAYQHQLTSLSPLTLQPGQKVYVKIQIYNQGYKAWDGNMRVATFDPPNRVSAFQDSSWLAYNRPASTIESSTAPGSLANFAFTMTAPATPGSFNERFVMVDDGVTNFDLSELHYQIDVVVPLVSVGPQRSVTYLKKGNYILSPQTHSTLILTNDGNLVLSVNFKQVWSTNTKNSGADYLVNQADGNLVLYTAQNKPVWASNTDGQGPTNVYLQTDGNMASYGTSGIVWSTGTVTAPDELSQVNETLGPGLVMRPNQRLETPSRGYALWLQGDGNLVLYNNVQHKPVWASNTDGKSVAYLVMQDDGNLVLYNQQSRPVWASNTKSGSPSTLWVQEDGNLVVYNASSRAVWATGTIGR